MHTYWFVTWEHEDKRDGTRRISNTILVGIHPVLWGARPPEVFAEYYTTRLLFFCEIPEEVARDRDAIRYFALHVHNEGVNTPKQA
jgi:hypothetical protein